jgi:hypothetical protein
MTERRKRDKRFFSAAEIAHRFKPGKSGNPAGRPKGSKNRATVLQDELDTAVTISESGRTKKATKFALICKQVVNAAVRGDFKAFLPFVKLLELTGTNLRAPTKRTESDSLPDLTKLSIVELSDLYRKLVARTQEDD